MMLLVLLNISTRVFQSEILDSLRLVSCVMCMSHVGCWVQTTYVGLPLYYGTIDRYIHHTKI